MRAFARPRRDLTFAIPVRILGEKGWYLASKERASQPASSRSPRNTSTARSRVPRDCHGHLRCLQTRRARQCRIREEEVNDDSERARERKAEIARERKREREKVGAYRTADFPRATFANCARSIFHSFTLTSTDSPRLIPHELEEISASSRERGAKGGQVERSSKAINR